MGSDTPAARSVPTGCCHPARTVHRPVFSQDTHAPILREHTRLSSEKPPDVSTRDVDSAAIRTPAAVTNRAR